MLPAPESDASALLWKIRYIPGVESAVAVSRGALGDDQVELTGWAAAWFYANETDDPSLAFLPPDHGLTLASGRLPAPNSLDEAIAGHELAQALGLRVGTPTTIQDRRFTVVGIWSPSRRTPGNFLQVSAAAARATLAGQAALHHITVRPAAGEDARVVSRRIWDALPTVDIVAPDQKQMQSRHEHAALAMSWLIAALLALLVTPVSIAGSHSSSRRWAIYASAVGLVLASGLARLINRYMITTLGLTPLHLSLRVIAVTLAFAAAVAIARFVSLGLAWRWATAVLVLTLAGATSLVAGALSMGMHMAL